jgi:hypothetical protein
MVSVAAEACMEETAAVPVDEETAAAMLVEEAWGPTRKM